MKTLGLILMAIRYCIFWTLSWLLTLLTWFLAPALALPCFVTIKNEREWLVKGLRWFQSFDNPLDEWWMAKPNNYCDNGKCTWLNWDFTKPFHRYLGRMFWLYRNPAYGFAQFVFGWGLTLKCGYSIVAKQGLWDSGTNNYLLVIYEDKKACIFNRYAFQLKLQYFFRGKRYLRINAGWKAHAGFNKLMLATHISPFRTWE